MTSPAATIISIVGISGDLAKRKLLPAIGQLATAGVLPKDFKIVGITRRSDVEIEPLLASTPNADFVREHLELFVMDLNAEADYNKLKARLETIAGEFEGETNRLFYLSVPPSVSRPIIELLGKTGLNLPATDKLMLEKPFGVDLESAKDLITHIDSFFQPDQVYRIDHYMAKEMAQNIVTVRAGNALLKRTWNSDFIESVEILASEEIGIEGRGTFYESTGALRDLVQSHLLQLAALTLMDLPGEDHMELVPSKRLEALNHLSLATDLSIVQSARRGQYQGYAAEASAPDSTIETFVSLTLSSSDPRWSGVPITITTGKALSAKATEVRITYKRTNPDESNLLILRLQPNEGIELGFKTKVPGYDKTSEARNLSFQYADLYKIIPEAYERVFLDCMHSDHALFATSEEVLRTWSILSPVQAAWARAGHDGLIKYRPGSKASDIS